MDMLADIIVGNWDGGIVGRRIRDRDRRRGVIRSIGGGWKLYKVVITKVPRSVSFPRRATMLPDEVILLWILLLLYFLYRKLY
jgi:hypothetical protein